MMLFDLESSPLRSILICGDYGSGKSEVSVNLALHLREAAERAALKLAIADLDLVNPYFRCREAREPLQAAGIRVVAPRDGQQHADLPILLPEVKGLLQDEHTLSVLDVGGDEVGARVLAGLAPFVVAGRSAFWFVVNQSRPFCDTTEGVLQAIARVEGSSGLHVTGLIANTHLMTETTPEMVLEGVRLAERVAAARELPLVLCAVMESMAAGLPEGALRYPLLPLRRLLTPPWLRPEPPRLGPALMRNRQG
jgi:hypothetical protein